jgi:hypothetical protein
MQTSNLIIVIPLWTIIHVIKLSTCRWPHTNSYSYPRVTVIRIDVHPAGETRPTRHTHPTLSPLMVPDHTYCPRSIHSNLSCSHQQSWAGHYYEKKGSWHNPQHVGRPIHGYVPCFSPKTTIEVVGAKPIFYWRPATRLTGPISLACDRYAQYLLMGAIPSVLNRHRRGLQPPKGPARS